MAVDWASFTPITGSPPAPTGSGASDAAPVRWQDFKPIAAPNPGATVPKLGTPAPIVKPTTNAVAATTPPVRWDQFTPIKAANVPAAPTPAESGGGFLAKLKQDLAGTNATAAPLPPDVHTLAADNARADAGMKVLSDGLGALKRGTMRFAGQSVMTAGVLSAGALASVADHIHSALTGKTQTGATDYVYGRLLKPVEDTLQANQEAPDASIADKVVSDIPGVVGTILEAGATGGASLEGAGAIEGTNFIVGESTPQYVARAMTAGLKGMSVPAVTAATHTTMSNLQNGVDLHTAVKQGLAAGVQTELMGVIPINAPGSVAKRVVTGATSMPLFQELGRRVTNAIYGAQYKNLKIGPQASDYITSIIEGAAFGVLPGHAEPDLGTQHAGAQERPAAATPAAAPEATSVFPGMREAPEAAQGTVTESRSPGAEPSTATADLAKLKPIEEPQAAPNPPVMRSERITPASGTSEQPTPEKPPHVSPVPSEPVPSLPTPHEVRVAAYLVKAQAHGLTPEQTAAFMPKEEPGQSGATHAPAPATQTSTSAKPQRTVSGREPAQPAVTVEKNFRKYTPPKSAALNPAKDDILAAIAKSGGIRTSDAIGGYGLDPADVRMAFGHGIRRVFTKNGMSPDAMAELLAQHGYPVTDTHGKYDPHLLMEHVEAALGGKKVWSNRAVDNVFARLQAEHEADQNEMAQARGENVPPASEFTHATGFDYHEPAYEETWSPSERVAHDLATRASQVDQDATEHVMEQWGKDAIDSREAANQFDAIIHRGSTEYAGTQATKEAGQVRETEGARPDNRAGARLPPERLPAETRQAAQPDLIGGATDTQQAVHREALARDAARNRGQESAETGRPDDLFSQARHQVDIEDKTLPPASTGAQRYSRPEDTRDLILQHNLSEENLLHADRIGGLAVPSLAITKVEHPINGYGDVTLLGDREMANPAHGLKVYSGDIYSPRYPDVVYKMSVQSRARLNEILRNADPAAKEYFGNDVRDLIAEPAFKKLAAQELGPDKNTYRDMKVLAEKLYRQSGAEEKIFKGFTDLGNRRYVDYTLDNIVKELKKNVRGGEGGSYGAGAVRAAATEQFRNLGQMRGARDRLVDRKQFEAVRDEANQRLLGLAERLSKVNSNAFMQGDRTAAMLQDVPRMGARRALQENGFDLDKDESLIPEINAFMDYLRQLPTGYFEGKFMRAVGLHEFKHAVIPDDLSSEARAVLAKHGLATTEYKQGSEVARQQAIENAVRTHGLLFSKREATSATAAPMSDEAVRAALAKTPLGHVFSALQHSGMLEILHDPGADWVGKWDGERAVLNSAKLHDSTSLAVAVHELGGHGAGAQGSLRDIVGEDHFTQIVKDLRTIGAGQDKAAQIVQRAMRRVESAQTPRGQRDDELVAYTLEEAVKSGNQWRMGRLRDVITRLLHAVSAWIKNGRLGALLKRAGVDLKLTPNDLVAMAYAHIRSLAAGVPEAGLRSEYGEPEPNYSTVRPMSAAHRGGFLQNALRVLSLHDNAFKYGVSGAKNIEGVFKDITPDDRVTAERFHPKLANGSVEKVWEVTTPNGRKAWVLQKRGTIWLDVSRLHEGDQGARLYAAVANYAHNAGKVFIGDPEGLSDVAIRRRTENMLSSALKFGTTRHLFAHELQMLGEDGTRPLDWRIGQNDHNLMELAETATKNTLAEAPELSDVRYNFDTGHFEGPDGRVWTDADFDRLAERNRARWLYDTDQLPWTGRSGHRWTQADFRGVDEQPRAALGEPGGVADRSVLPPGGKDALAGRTRESGSAHALVSDKVYDPLRGEPTAGGSTLKRGVLLNTILHAEREAGPERREAILDRLRGERPQALLRLFYSKPAPEEPREPEDFSDLEDDRAAALHATQTARETAAQWLRETKGIWHKSFPDRGEPVAREVADRLASFISRRERAEAVYWHDSRVREKTFNQLSKGKRLNFLDKLESGHEFLDPASRALAGFYRETADKLYEAEQRLGIAYDYRTRYFPHIWKDPEAVEQYFAQKYPGWGKPGFSKFRLFDTIKEGRDAGFKLKSDNPEVLFRMRYTDHLRNAMQRAVVQDLRDLDLMRPAPGTKPGERVTPDMFGKIEKGIQKGEALIHTPDGTFITTENAARILKNGLFSQSLWQDRGIAGMTFRGWMELKSVIVPLQLGISAYHLNHVFLGVRNAQGMANALKTLLDGPPTPERLLRVGKQYALHMTGLGETAWNRVWNAMGVYKGTAEPMDDSQRQAVQYMLEGGFTPVNPLEYRTTAMTNFKDALDKLGGEDGKAAAVGLLVLHTLPTALRSLQYPIMDVAVPFMKTQAYLEAVGNKLRGAPDLVNDQRARIQAFNEIRRQIDERFGEMAYNKMFWNRHLQNVMQASMLSFTWNYGFLRQFGGGLYDLGKLATQVMHPTQARQFVTERSLYALHYVAIAALIGGLMTELIGGQKPKSIEDLVYPVVGHQPDGTPERVNTMFFTREFGAMYYHMSENGMKGLLQMAVYKGAPMFSMLQEQLTNQDYYHREISDPTAGIGTQILQRGHAWLNEMLPFSVSGNLEQQETAPKNWALSFSGFNPAPGYVDNTPLEEKIYALYGEYNGGLIPYAQAQQIQAVRQLHGTFEHAGQDAFSAQLAQDAAKYQWSKATIQNLVKGVYEPPGAGVFRQLPPAWQIQLIDGMTAAQRRQYSPYITKQAWRLMYQRAQKAAD